MFIYWIYKLIFEYENCYFNFNIIRNEIVRKIIMKKQLIASYINNTIILIK